MIIYEVLRMYPPVPFIVGAPTKAVKLGDKMQSASRYYSNPIDSISEGISGATKTQFSSTPFSSGPRVCIGQNFEAKLALVMMLQRFSFELSPSYRHAPFPIMTLQPQYGAPMILHKL
ncbi:hypothetical protein ACS0TY_024503 [Phlomoides rotata]